MTPIPTMLDYRILLKTLKNQYPKRQTVSRRQFSCRGDFCLSHSYICWCSMFLLAPLSTVCKAQPTLHKLPGKSSIIIISQKTHQTKKDARCANQMVTCSGTLSESFSLTTNLMFLRLLVKTTATDTTQCRIYFIFFLSKHFYSKA